MEAPSISARHLKELEQKFPHAFYTWRRENGCFEVWCDERRGLPPYKFMDCAGPSGEYREPGDWVIRALHKTDPDTGEYQVGTKYGRQKWLQSLEDRDWKQKQQRARMEKEKRQLRNSARFINRHGRVVSPYATVEPKARHMKKTLGG
tara:strand:+ start:5379 stop:5822 length:444 start_codon:yes stop_codon:yes gene_type:complete